VKAMDVNERLLLISLTQGLEGRRKRRESWC